MSFLRKCVIITGSSNGIGKATALLLASKGANVMIHGTKQDCIHSVVEQCRKVGVKGAVFPSFQGRIESEEVMETITAIALKEFGQLDVLINNAGARLKYDLRTSPMADFDEQIALNLKSPVRMSQLCLPALAESGGNIVNVSSCLGVRPSSVSSSFYAISKAGLNMFTRCAALEFANDGVRVNAVCPGPIPTEAIKRMGMTNEQANAYYKRFSTIIPTKSVGNVDKTSKLIAYLASEDASMINGQCIVEDGGLSLTGLQYDVIRSLSKETLS